MDGSFKASGDWVEGLRFRGREGNLRKRRLEVGDAGANVENDEKRLKKSDGVRFTVLVEDFGRELVLAND